MTGTELLGHLRQPGEVLLWIEQIEACLPIQKASLRNTLASLSASELAALDVSAEWEDDRLFVITDFGPT